MDLDFQTGAFLLLIAAVVAMLTRRLRLPYSVGPGCGRNHSSCAAVRAASQPDEGSHFHRASPSAPF